MRRVVDQCLLQRAMRFRHVAEIHQAQAAQVVCRRQVRLDLGGQRGRRQGRGGLVGAVIGERQLVLHAG
jgi:hypothetical protein